MKIIADTNILVRAFVDDDPGQGRIAKASLLEAGVVVIGRHAVCELVWVLGRRYKFPKTQISGLVRQLMDRENVVTDRAAVEAGLAAMDAGADFADGVIAYEGRWLGGETFASFDGKAVSAIAKQGHEARLLASETGSQT